MVEEKYEKNYADFIKFMNKDGGIKRSPSVNENKKTNAVKRTPSIRPFDETKRSIGDVKTVFDELYQSKLENLNRETQLTETQLESNKLETLINKAIKAIAKWKGRLPKYGDERAQDRVLDRGSGDTEAIGTATAIPPLRLTQLESIIGSERQHKASNAQQNFPRGSQAVLRDRRAGIDSLM
ncbi:hypothetical protein D920_01688 [Enterococcus faecalis 13-SD-W-01]|nr:hypothetical protein D920_01688 [Enterococcus faecalis 13-SD-W-01]